MSPISIAIHAIGDCLELYFALSNDLCSYAIMQSCWESEPEDRPQFCELVSTISNVLESAAGYLELAMSLQQDDEPEPQREPRADGDQPGNDA